MKFLSQINVNTEYTLPIVDGNNGQVLTTDGSGAVYWGNVSAGATNLNALTDVEITSPSSDQILVYGIPLGGSVAVWYNKTPNYLTTASSINALGDVTISTATTGQLLQWNGSQWVNATLSTVEYVSKVQHLVKCGVAVTKGQAVYVTTSDGTNMIVGLASNASEPTSSKVIGLAASTGAINDQIYVVTEGLIAGLDTSTATAGDPVWLGTNGNLIFGLLNKPVAPAHLVYLGVVTRVQQNNGEIFVNVQNGFELNELHDVLISSPSTGQLIRRDSDGLWKNWSPNFLTSYTETDPIFSASAAAGITSTNITNWNTAYNDSIRAIAFNTTNGILTLTQQDAGTLTVDLDGRYLTSFSESDPVFEASAAAGITNEDIAFWDTAYGWGNHADAGYLTSFTEADTLATVAARGNISNTKLQIRTAGNAAGGNLQLGPYSDGASKWAYITAQHYNSSTEPEGFTLIGGLAQNGQNAVVIGGNIYESNPATEIQFWTHTSDTHSTGGTQRGVINSSGNWGIGTTSPSFGLSVEKATTATAQFNVNGNMVASFKSSTVAANAWAGIKLMGDEGSGIWFSDEGGTYNHGYISQRYTGQLDFATGTDSTAAATVKMTILSTGNVGINRTSPSYKLDVAGNARFDNELYVGGVWSSSYGPRDSNGNINFVDWSSNVIARINRVSGITSVGNRKLSMGILDINSQGTPEIRINTKIPFALGAADFTVNIKGFQYGGTNMVSLSIGWHYYLSQFYNETAISNGAFAPNITLAVDESNMVVIHLSNVGYWPKLYVESVYSSAYADDYVANWSWTDAGVDALSNVTPVAYKPLDTSITGNAAYATNAGNSTTTSQTNFSTLTVSNNTVATQAWVTSQGYATSFSETDTLATVTGRGSTTTSAITVRGITSTKDTNQITINRVDGGGATWQFYSWPGGLNIFPNAQLPIYIGRDGSVTDLSLWNGKLLFGTKDAIDGNSDSWLRLNNSGSYASGVYTPGQLRSDGLLVNYGGARLYAGAIVTGNTEVSGTLYAAATVVTASEGREVQTYMPSSYTTDDLVSGHEYGWYSDHWRLGMTRSGGQPGADFVVQWNGARRLSLTNGGNLTATGNIYATGGNSTQWNTAYGWGNHADAPYWNVSLNQDVQVEAQNVTFAGNVIIQGTLTESSSIRFKENIKPLEPALAKVEQLNPVTYTKITSQEEEIGLIAEEVAELFPEVVTYNENGQPQGIQYQRLSVILLKAVQELSNEVKELKEKLK